jgi:hypothetical protein
MAANTSIPHQTPDSSRNALVDLAIVIASFMVVGVGAWSAHLSAAGTLAVIGAFAAASWRLSVRGSSWRTIGVRRPDSWPKTVGWAVVLYGATALLVVGVVTPLSNALHWPAMDLSRFSALRGNALALAGWLVVAWTTAAFGEELLFRGFLTTQLLTLLGTGWAAIGAAVVIQSALFAIGHAYLGARGVVTAGCVGLVYGTAYVCNRRNLTPLILAHGLTDSLSLVAIYLGASRLGGG